MVDIQASNHHYSVLTEEEKVLDFKVKTPLKNQPFGCNFYQTAIKENGEKVNLYYRTPTYQKVSIVERLDAKNKKHGRQHYFNNEGEKIQLFDYQHNVLHGLSADFMDGTIKDYKVHYKGHKLSIESIGSIYHQERQDNSGKTIVDLVKFYNQNSPIPIVTEYPDQLNEVMKLTILREQLDIVRKKEYFLKKIEELKETMETDILMKKNNAKPILKPLKI